MNLDAKGHNVQFNDSFDISFQYLYRADKRYRENMSHRRAVDFHDWINVALLVFIGILLGIAIESVYKLIAMGAWFIALIVTVPFLFVFLLEILMDKVFNQFFTIGVRRVYEPKNQKKKPLIVMLSFPTSFVFGFLLAKAGMGNTFLDFAKNLLG